MLKSNMVEAVVCVQR